VFPFPAAGCYRCSRCYGCFKWPTPLFGAPSCQNPASCSQLQPDLYSIYSTEPSILDNPAKHHQEKQPSHLSPTSLNGGYYILQLDLSPLTSHLSSLTCFSLRLPHPHHGFLFTRLDCDAHRVLSPKRVPSLYTRPISSAQPYPHYPQISESSQVALQFAIEK
jgi:hypothetical protein